MKKGKDLESDYFIRENLASAHKNRVERDRIQLKEHDEKLKLLHFMKCPKCGHDLTVKRMSYIDVEQCTSCGALVLDADKVEKFIAEEKSILKSLIDLFIP
jgi:ribosomal protein L37AE/L43A